MTGRKHAPDHDPGAKCGKNAICDPPSGRAARRAALADPDRPLLRLLNWAQGLPVLAMCGLRGDHDPAHAAAGRLPVRFHKYSDVRLYWREFGGGRSPSGMLRNAIGDNPDWQRFAALIVLTNAGEPIIDWETRSAIKAFLDCGAPVLWGEAGPGRAVAWRPKSYVEPIEAGWLGAGDGFRFAADGSGPEPVEFGYAIYCGSHFRLTLDEGPG